MRRPAGLLASAALVVALSGGALGQEPTAPGAKPAADEAPGAIGASVPRLLFKDTRFLLRSLDDFGAPRAYVLAFVTQQCPVARRYLPALDRLATAYRERGVQVVVVDAGLDQDLLAMARFALEFDLAAPIVKDTDGSAARALGITRTPEVALLDGQRVLRYRGRIDDRVRPGGAREAPTRRDLEEALEEVLAGKAVTVPETPVDGCLLPERAPEPAGRGPGQRRAGAPRPAPPTWTADVAPLVRRHCQDCHRAGGSAPFPLERYDDVARDGDMIAEVVAEGRMPPWFATGGPDRFRNHRGLSPAERDTIVAWVEGGLEPGEGAPPGGAAPVATASTWSISPGGDPDLVVRMPRPIKVPAEGVLPYQYVILPQRFEHDTWVQRLELRSDTHPEVLHHANLFFLLPGRPFDDGQVIAGKVPGSTPLVLDDGVAALIPEGALLGLQLHYQPIGKAVEHSMSIGLCYPRARVQKRFRGDVIENRELLIPPGAPHHRLDATHTFEADVLAGGLFGHMHLRGKDVSFKATTPDGTTDELLTVPAYSFDWQMAYELAGPRRFPKGTRLDVTAHFDNSAWNPWNPDPTKAVGFGLQTTQEMLYCFVYYVLEDEALDLDVDPATGAPR